MPSLPVGAHSSTVWRSQAELPVHSHSSHCNSLSGSQSYHYHSVNVPQAEHPGLADTREHLAGYAFEYSLTNIELAGMHVEFLHVCVWTCFYSCGLHIWNSCLLLCTELVYLTIIVAGLHIISMILILCAL